MQITAVRDFQRGVRICNGQEEKIDFPASNVLYFELTGGNWVCIRPSGTEPKIKLYIATKAADQATADAQNAALAAAAKAMLER